MYITRTTSFPATCKHVQKILKEGVGTSDIVILNAMGAAITRCCDVALAVCHAFEGLVTNSVETSTVDVVDDFEPLTEVKCIPSNPSASLFHDESHLFRRFH